MDEKTEKAVDIDISHADFLAARESLIGRRVDFNTSHHSYTGSIGSVYDTKFGPCIAIASPKRRKRFTKESWQPWFSDTLMVVLGARDLIKEINGSTKIYIAFANTNNIIIHKSG